MKNLYPATPATSIELAEEKERFYDHFVSVQGRHCAYYRIHASGVSLANFIFSFKEFGDSSDDPEVILKTARLYKVYGSYYKRLTGFDFDESAPREEGDINDLLESLLSSGKCVGELMICSCPKCCK
jgi:hypothetical protein